MDTTIKYTAANSPWQNGTVERHHYTADVVFAKVMSDNPNMDPQKAVDKAAFCKNSEINQTGFSSLQLIMGKSPTFPGLAEAKPRSNDLDSSNKALRTLKDIDDIRVKFREADCSRKLRKIHSERINPSVEQFYQMGDPVLFRDPKKNEWKPGVALIRFGKTLYLKYGNWLRRVPVDMLIPDSLNS